MTDTELELDAMCLYLEASVADLRDLLVSMPRASFATDTNRQTFLRLREVACDITAMYLAAHALTTQPKETT